MKDYDYFDLSGEDIDIPVIRFDEPEINFDEPEINFDESKIDSGKSAIDSGIPEQKNDVKRNEIHRSKIVSADEIFSRDKKYDTIPFSREVSEKNSERNSEENTGTPEESKETPEETKKVERKNLILKSKKTKMIGNVVSLEDSEDEPVKNEDLVIDKTVRKDLVLSKSKFSERKPDSYSWSYEALGVEGRKSSGKSGSKAHKHTTSNKVKKQEEKQKSSVPLSQIVLSCIVLVGFISFLIYNKSGLGLSRIDGKDMYPTLNESSFYKLSEVTDYNELGYFDIVTLQDGDIKFASRLIGFPGDTVIVKRDGVYLNNEKIDPSIIGGEFNYQYIIQDSTNKFKFNDGSEDYLYFPLEAGSNLIFVLGDNHSNCRDSLTFGPISVEYVKEVVEVE